MKNLTLELFLKIFNVEIYNLKSYNNKNCIAAYKKKQEFDGGLMKLILWNAMIMSKK